MFSAMLLQSDDSPRFTLKNLSLQDHAVIRPCSDWENFNLEIIDHAFMAKKNMTNMGTFIWFTYKDVVPCKLYYWMRIILHLVRVALNKTASLTVLKFPSVSTGGAFFINDC
jgi:hypothetical protein